MGTKSPEDRSNLQSDGQRRGYLIYLFFLLRASVFSGNYIFINIPATSSTLSSLVVAEKENTEYGKTVLIQDKEEKNIEEGTKCKLADYSTLLIYGRDTSQESFFPLLHLDVSLHLSQGRDK